MPRVLPLACVAVLFAVSSVSRANAGAIVVRFEGGANAADRRYDFGADLLRLALQRTDSEYGRAELRHAPASDQNQMVKDVVSRKADVIVRPIVLAAPEGTVRVPFPLRMGLLGYRVLLIRKSDRARFAKISRLEELTKFRLGFVTDWQDYPVYKNAGFPIVDTTDYDELFRMLPARKVDFLSRSVTEVAAELENRKAELKDVEIEKRLLLYYHLDASFYVSAANPKLAERLLKGYRAIRADGGYEALFNRYFAKELKALRIPERKIIEIPNHNIVGAFTPEEYSEFVHPSRFADFIRFHARASLPPSP